VHDVMTETDMIPLTNMFLPHIHETAYGEIPLIYIRRRIVGECDGRRLFSSSMSSFLASSLNES
jgi:hypothetical protein